MRQEWGEQELQFADPYAQKVMQEKYGRLTFNSAQNIKTLNSTFGQELRSFEEMRFFNGVEHLYRVFSPCPNLTGTITIPESVKLVSVVCFFQTKLEGIEFLAQDFRWSAMCVRQNANLKWIKMHSIEPPQKIDTNKTQFDFDSGNNTWKLYVPDGSVDKYKNDFNFRNLKERIRPMSEFKE